MLWSLLVSIALAAPVFGARYVPPGRGDLAWVADQRTTGRAVGEFDGFVAPALSAYAGAWTKGHVGVFGSLGIARLTTTSWTGDAWRQRHWGVLRPSIDARWAFGERVIHRPIAWVDVVAHGDIPSARDTANTYTDAQQAAADDSANVERLRLGGFGGGAGFGVDYRLNEHVTLGASWTLGTHFGVLRTSESQTTSSWVVAETALALAFEWPRKESPP